MQKKSRISWIARRRKFQIPFIVCGKKLRISSIGRENEIANFINLSWKKISNFVNWSLEKKCKFCQSVWKKIANFVNRSFKENTNFVYRSQKKISRNNSIAQKESRESQKFIAWEKKLKKKKLSIRRWKKLQIFIFFRNLALLFTITNFLLIESLLKYQKTNLKWSNKYKILNPQIPFRYIFLAAASLIKVVHVHFYSKMYLEWSKI